MPVNTIVHKQDWYRTEEYKGDYSPEKESFLEQSYEKHFNERPYLNHECYLFLTKTSGNKLRSNSVLSSLCRPNLITSHMVEPGELEAFFQSVSLMKNVLEQSPFIKVEALTQEQIVGSDKKGGLLQLYLTLDKREKVVLKDISIQEDKLLLGDQRLMFHSISDLKDMPDQVSPYEVFNKLSTPNNECFLSFAAPLGLLLDCNHIYNQYLFIEKSPEVLKKLEKRTKNLYSLSKFGKENLQNSQGNSAYLQAAQKEGKVSIKAHFNIMSWSSCEKQAKSIREQCSTAITYLDCVPKYCTIDAPALYWAGIPGNSGDFPMEESFLTFYEQATCFFAQETNYRSSTSSFGVKLSERLSGKPILVDFSDLPLEKGIINNRNKFIIGPSGSGKSFFTNHILRQYYDQGAHILLVDTGDSYQGLCNLIKQQTGEEDGLYYTYTQENPLCFNPFYYQEKPYDISKKQSLQALLIALWKRKEDILTRSEQVWISNAISLYDLKVQQREVTPGFNSFYEFLKEDFSLELQKNKVKERDFDLSNLLTVLQPYYKGGEYDFLLNASQEIDPYDKRFVVFEIDALKDHEILFGVVTIILMELFIRKLRNLHGVRKVILIEEAWKAIAKPEMVNYIQYLFKTVRKYYGEAIIVTQEIEDIISSEVVKQAIINNSDCKILLDQRKYINKFEHIQSLLGLSDKQKSQILSINLGNDPNRKYKEVWIGLSTTHSAVYATEVSSSEY